MLLKHKAKYKIGIAVLILFISIIHYSSGAVNSPLHEFYRLLYFIPVILSAFHFGFKGATVTALLVSFMYSPHILLAFGFKMQAVNELLDIVLFFTVGIITGILVEKKNIAFLGLDVQLNKYILLEKYTNSIIESIKSGVIAINKDFLITSINNGAKEILSIQSDCIGLSFTEVFSCCKEMENHIVKALNNNELVENIEIQLREGNGEKIIKFSLFPLSLEKVNKGLVITVEDITVMKKIQQQIQRNDKLASVGQLATGIAHEIRNPLAIIKMIEQTMKKEMKGNGEVIRELDIIDEEVERANKVIKELMEFAKTNKNVKTYGALNGIIEEVLTITNKYLDQHKVKVLFKNSELPAIKFDKEQFKQAFINLIFNAVDAMPGGGDLLISTEEVDGKWVKVTFKDTGEGIKEENIQRIFDPFFTTKSEGTGLGLPIIHRIIEEHEGSIHVFSKIGEGTEFEIRFPYWK